MRANTHGPCSLSNQWHKNQENWVRMFPGIFVLIELLLFWADSVERYDEARHKKYKSGVAPVCNCHSTRSSQVIFISQIEPGYKISSELDSVILCELVASAARSVVLERRISRVDTMYWRQHLSNPPCKPKFNAVGFARRPPTKKGRT